MDKKCIRKIGRKKHLLFLFILFGLGISVSAQTYTIQKTEASSYPQVQPYDDGVYCLFKTSAKKATTTVFKKVFLNRDLKVYDSLSYSIEGAAKLISSCSDERYITHTFYSKTKSEEKIIFIVTDKTGNVRSTFSKRATDFSSYFPRPLKKLKQVQLSFIPNNGSPGMLLIRPYQITGSRVIQGKIFALNAETGAELWACNIPQLSNVQATEKLLIGLTTVTNSSGFNTSYSQQIQFVDKTSGELIKSVPFVSKDKGYRDISVFTTDDNELMVAGSEYESYNTKNGRFYMTMYNLSGERIFDNVDSAARLSTRRMHLMGSVFNQDGDLVLIAEGWKPDATRAIATTAASILAASLLGGYANVYARVDHKIDNVVFATLSPVDGSLKNFKTFPVGPWLNYGRLMTIGSHALFAVSGQVIIYNVNDPNAPPVPFTSLRMNESLILTQTGAIINKQEKYQCVLSLVH